jgi:hypothetical protein
MTEPQQDEQQTDDGQALLPADPQAFAQMLGTPLEGLSPEITRGGIAGAPCQCCPSQDVAMASLGH